LNTCDKFSIANYFISFSRLAISIIRSVSVFPLCAQLSAFDPVKPNFLCTIQAICCGTTPIYIFGVPQLYHVLYTYGISQPWIYNSLIQFQWYTCLRTFIYLWLPAQVREVYTLVCSVILHHVQLCNSKFWTLMLMFGVFGRSSRHSCRCLEEAKSSQLEEIFANSEISEFLVNKKIRSLMLVDPVRIDVMLQTTFVHRLCRFLSHLFPFWSR